MPLQTLDQFTSTVSDLPDKPNTQMTAAELKAQFDAAPEELRQKYNALVSVLKSSASGDSGAENIGATSISGVTGNTVQGQMSNIFTQLQQVVLGQLPNKSITREKFADGAVDFSPVQKEIANLNLQLQASQLVPSGKTYGWNPTTSFGVIVDFTRGKTTAQLNAGNTDLTGKVTMSEGTFTAGKKVTVLGRNPLDNSIVKEEATITSVSPLTISPLVNSYKAGAWIKRTTASNTASGFRFGGLDESVINSVTDATVVNQAYDTSGNGGRKLVSLKSGNQYAVMRNGTTEFRIYKSTDKWATPGTLFFSFSRPNGISDVSLATNGTHIFLIFGTNSTDTGLGTRVLDENGTVISSVNADIGQSAFGNTSLTINEAGTELHATWASKNATYANTFNIRYAKGTINTDGTVTWGAVEQVTIAGSDGTYNITEPTIILDKEGIPLIFVNQWGSYHTTGQNNATTARALTVLKRNNSLSAGSSISANWSARSITYNTNSYNQSSPSAIFVPQSVNGLANGRIWVTWHGMDSTDTARENTRVAYSDDGGVTWSAMQKLTSGNTNRRYYPSITANKNNKIFIMLMDGSGGLYKLENSSGTWSNQIQVDSNGTTTLSAYPSTLFDLSLNFTEPLFIYKTNAKVGFYGTWTIGSVAPITENTLRFTLTQQAKEVMTYLKHTAGLTATAKVNGTVMDKTTTTTESQFTKVLASLQDIEVEITLSRATVNDDITIDKILGGVA